MRIVQAIESSGPGGAEQVLLRLCDSLRREGHDVRVLLLRGGWLQHGLEKEGFEVQVLRIAHPLDPRFLGQLTRLLERTPTDVFHSHEITFALYGRAATAHLGLTHVATAHGGSFARGWKRRSLGALALRAGRRFRLVAVSESLAADLAMGLLMDRRSIDVVPNGIEMPPSDLPSVRTTTEPLRIVAVGNLYPVKNHRLLIQAASALVRDGLAVELDILGRGVEEAELERLIEDLGVAEQVRLQGFRPDVPEFLARAHVFASSSLSEAMPLSFLEAMARGLPVVASRVGGVSELVEHGVRGLLFESGSVDQAAGALASLARDEGLRQRLGENARRFVRGSFGADRMVRCYLDLYRELAAA